MVGVGWNSRGFDNPVLRLTALRNRIFCLEGLARQTQCGRYDGVHADLADLVSGYGASRTLALAAVCEALEIPCKTSVGGGDVGALWRAGDVAAIEAYVSEDVCASYLVWLHWAAWKAADPAELALPLADFAAWLRMTPGLEHLAVFADCAPALWACEQAPSIRAARALAQAERRVARERDEAAFAAGGPRTA